jgi:hypothetical protein
MRKVADALEDSEPMFFAVSNSVRNQSIRVFEQGGVGPDGAPGRYSSKPLYVNPADSVRKFPLKGKNGGGAQFKNGKPRKTSYFQSYADFKRTIGEPAFVNLRVFGNLARAYGTGVAVRKENGQVRVFHQIRLDASNPSGKINGLISKYPGAFRPTKKELAEFREDLQNYTNDLVERIIGG